MSTGAQWMAAWGSVGGAVATTVAVVLAYLGLRGEIRRANEQRALDAEQREQDRRERRDREAAQARLVLVAVEHAAAGQRGPGLLGRPTAYGEVTVKVSNHSQSPVLVADLEHVLLRIPGDPPDTGEVEPAQSWVLVADAARSHGPVPPGEQHSWPAVIFEPTGPDASHQRTVLDSDVYEARVAFTDASGLRWRRRSGAGQPERVWIDPDRGVIIRAR